MFWKKNKHKKGKESQKPSREDIIRQATESMQAKREEIGDETLEAIRAAIHKKQNDPLAKAKNQIKNADLDDVLDHLSLWLEEDKK